MRATEVDHRLRGRDPELRTIADRLDVLASGRGAAVVVEGRAGMGKTRLLAEVDALARERGMTVGRGAGDSGNTIVQLAPLLEALLEGKPPVLERDALRDALTSPDQRYWLLQDIEALLKQAAAAAPVVIVLDDLQWADSGTVAAIRSLPARLSAVPIAWFLASRPGAASAAVQAALDDVGGRGERLALGPLDDDAVAHVIADVLQAQPDAGLLQLAARAGGNPHLLVELLTGLRDERLVRVTDGRVEAVESRLPKRVSEGMHRRLAGVSEPARQLATVAASLGRRFFLGDVAAMLESPPSALLGPLDELTHASLMAAQADALSFHHDLTRDAVRSSVPTAVRRALDRQAAMVLLAGGALPLEVATQLAASAQPGDEVAITTLLKAAEASAATDPGVAADLGRCALDLAPPKHALRGPLVAGTAVWLHAAARPEEAKAFADTALRDVLSPTQEAEVRLAIGRMFSISPDLRADTCRTALALPGLRLELRARLLAILLHCLVVASRTEEARSLQPEARRIVDRSGDLDASFVLVLAQAGLFCQEGDYARAVATAEAAQRIGLETSDATRVDLARMSRCDNLLMLDRFDEALQLSTDNVGAAQRNGQGWALRNFGTNRARLLLQLGRLADAAAILRERYSADAASEVVNTIDAAGLGALGRVAIHLGDEDWTRRTAHIARVVIENGAPAVRRHAVWLLALQALADDDATRAHGWLCTHGREERLSVLPLFPTYVGDEARLVDLALRVGDHELATVACDGAQRRSKLNPETPSAEAAAAHAAGLLHHDVDKLARAVELFAVGRRPLALAAALEDLGCAALDNGDTGRAIDAFTRALRTYADVGAVWDAGRARQRLRSLGIRRRVVAPQRPVAGWQALTESEAAVAQLVAQGLTNRGVASHLFVSPHTVSGHLRSIFTKLGVNHGSTSPGSPAKPTSLAEDYASGQEMTQARDAG